MFLVLPHSMVIPEALQRLEDDNFEDWLTASVIETANQPTFQDGFSKDAHQQTSGITDLWMLEIAERRGKVWTGKFQVQIGAREEERSEAHNGTESSTEERCFALNTKTAEITFRPCAGLQQIAISRVRT
jgi:hypothetical protein